MYQRQTIEGVAVAAGLWLREIEGVEAYVRDGALYVPMGLPPGEARDAEMRAALALWMCLRAGVD